MKWGTLRPRIAPFFRKLTGFFRKTAGILAKTRCFTPENDSSIWQNWGERLLPERQHELEKNAAGILGGGSQDHTDYGTGAQAGGWFSGGASDDNSWKTDSLS